MSGPEKLMCWAAGIAVVSYSVVIYFMLYY